MPDSDPDFVARMVVTSALHSSAELLYQYARKLLVDLYLNASRCSTRIATTEPIPEPARCSESETFATQNHYSECRSASPPITNEEAVVELRVTVVPQRAQLSVGGKPFRPHAKWYLLHARDVETKFHARMRGRTPCEYMERLYQCFLRLYLKGVCGAMFEIDDEEETLQTLLDKLRQCTEGILNVAGVGKTYRLVEDIIRDVALVHSWLFEIQTDVFCRGPGVHCLSA
ncbi:hypothetical protein EDD18DRAFT_1117178 [Armillaria luteobubalina]|uniref:Uncharacterized protein n=1 Tax=Armillaria luteobubalina TaxID=153913 RepID=A0AA39TYV7_9AGAR|nr:hypothetical protein EDD18DRAFT_1117178 [Armillaria luteobubalina]